MDNNKITCAVPKKLPVRSLLCAHIFWNRITKQKRCHFEPSEGRILQGKGEKLSLERSEKSYTTGYVCLSLVEDFSFAPSSSHSLTLSK
ncbi:hypothetical protein FHS10_004746 [Mucilaginibacter dorajii]|nr:hypothetical protein [Mucilaginibacter dorajii]